MASNIDIKKNASGVANYLLPTKPRHDAVRIVVLTLPTKKERLDCVG